MDKERGQSYNEHKHLYKNFITNIDKDMEHAVVKCEIKQGGKTCGENISCGIFH